MAITRIPIPAWEKNHETDDRLDLRLAEIDLAVRTVNGLEEEGIFTVRDLLSCQPERLLAIPNFAEKTLETVFAALEKIGFHRKPGHLRAIGTGQPTRRFALLND